MRTTELIFNAKEITNSVYYKITYIFFSCTFLALFIYIFCSIYIYFYKSTYGQTEFSHEIGKIFYIKKIVSLLFYIFSLITMLMFLSFNLYKETKLNEIFDNLMETTKSYEPTIISYETSLNEVKKQMNDLTKENLNLKDSLDITTAELAEKKKVLDFIQSATAKWVEISDPQDAAKILNSFNPIMPYKTLEQAQTALKAIYSSLSSLHEIFSSLNPGENIQDYSRMLEILLNFVKGLQQNFNDLFFVPQKNASEFFSFTSKLQSDFNIIKQKISLFGPTDTVNKTIETVTNLQNILSILPVSESYSLSTAVETLYKNWLKAIETAQELDGSIGSPEVLVNFLRKLKTYMNSISETNINVLFSELDSLLKTSKTIDPTVNSLVGNNGGLLRMLNNLAFNLNGKLVYTAGQPVDFSFIGNNITQLATANAQLAAQTRALETSQNTITNLNTSLISANNTINSLNNNINSIVNALKAIITNSSTMNDILNFVNSIKNNLSIVQLNTYANLAAFESDFKFMINSGIVINNTSIQFQNASLSIPNTNQDWANRMTLLINSYKDFINILNNYKINVNANETETNLVNDLITLFSSLRNAFALNPQLNIIPLVNFMISSSYTLQKVVTNLSIFDETTTVSNANIISKNLYDSYMVKKQIIDNLMASSWVNFKTTHDLQDLLDYIGASLSVRNLDHYVDVDEFINNFNSWLSSIDLLKMEWIVLPDINAVKTLLNSIGTILNIYHVAKFNTINDFKTMLQQWLDSYYKN